MSGGGQRGVTLVVVLWIIMVLSLLIGGFAFTMHVETQIASFGRKQLKARALARSGIEVVRVELAQQTGGEGGYVAFNQSWATNETLLVSHALGEGTFTVKLMDEQGKLPLNKLTPDQWHRLFDLLGVDALDADVIVDSIEDWKDDNDLHRLNGAEDDYYMKLSPPYRAKNGAFDRVDELMLVRGMTRELFDGIPAAGNDPGKPGLRELLTAINAGQVNVNTASAFALRVLLDLDEAQTDAIISRRNGADGEPGTEDDQPFKSVEEFLASLTRLSDAARQEAQQLITVNSNFFTARSTGDVGGAKRTILATLWRQGNQAQIVSWREQRGGS
jgi:general secretion pathway protein K